MRFRFRIPKAIVTIIPLFMMILCIPAAFASNDITSSAGSTYLNGIKISAGTLKPEFIKTKNNYNIKLGQDESSVTITQIKEDKSARMTIGGTVRTRGSFSASNGKTTTVPIKIANGKKSKIYKLNKTRIKSSDNNLSSLSVSRGELSPSFSPDQTQYTLHMGEGTAKVTLYAKAEAGKLAKISYTKSYTLKNGQTKTANIKVKAQSGGVKIYTVTITRDASSNANLKSLKTNVKKAPLSPRFNTGVTDYTIVLPEATKSVTISAVKSDTLSNMKIDGSNKTSKKITVEKGKSIITNVIVTAQAGNSKTYNITVERKPITPVSPPVNPPAPPVNPPAPPVNPPAPPVNPPAPPVNPPAPPVNPPAPPVNPPAQTDHGIAWDFSQGESGWKASDDSLVSFSQTDKSLLLTSNGTAPQISSPDFKTPSTASYLIVKIKNNSNADYLKVVFKSSKHEDTNNISSQQMIKITNNDSGFQTYITEMQTRPYWEGDITALSILPNAEGPCVGNILIASVELTDKSPYTSENSGVSTKETYDSVMNTITNSSALKDDKDYDFSKLGKMKVGAYFWYAFSNNGDYLTDRLYSEFPDRKPVWGWVSDTVGNMQEQIEYALAGGLSYFAFDWYMALPGMFYQDRAADIFLEASKNTSKKMEFCLNICNHEGAYITKDNWKKSVDLWMPYLTNDQYLKVDGKPVLMFYSSYYLEKYLGGAEGMNECFDYLDSKLREKGIDGALIIGSECPYGTTTTRDTDYNLSNYDAAAWSSLIGNRKTEGFYGLTGYNYRQYSPVTLGDGTQTYSTPYKTQTAQHEDCWNRFSEQKMRYVPCLLGGWDCRPWETQWSGNTTGYRSCYCADRTPQDLYTHVLHAAQWMKNNPDCSVGNLAILYAWNEVCEGGYVEPTKGDNGAMLSALRQAMQRINDNPKPPLKDYTFSFSNDTAGWYIGSPQVTGLESSNGLLNITVKGATPIILSSNISISSEDHYMVIRMKNNTNTSSMNMFFRNDVDTPAFTGDALVTFNVNSNDTAMTDYVVDMSKCSCWKGNITQLRFDLYSTPGDYNGNVQIESITFTSKSP